MRANAVMYRGGVRRSAFVELLIQAGIIAYAFIKLG